MAAGRVLFIDACLPKRLAPELAYRGRTSRHHGLIGVTDLDDDVLIPRLAAEFAGQDWILVTADDHMPDDWGALLIEHDVTVATVDGRVPDAYSPEQWKADTVHRWAHAMEVQADATWHRYSPTGHRLWTNRRRSRLPKS